MSTPQSQPPYPGPPPAPWPGGQVPGYGPARLPTTHPLPAYPGQVHQAPPGPASSPQRPALVGMSTMMAVTASMLFMAALGFLWMLAWAGNESLDYNTQGPLYYLMERFHLRLAQGLWVPLFGFPTATVGLAFCLLAHVRWARIAYTALAVAAVVWMAWTWHAQGGYLVAPIVYIGFCVGILWVSSVSRWLAWPDPRSGATRSP